MDDSVFSIRLNEVMEKRKMKQKDLAEKTGLTRQSISSYCQGTSFPDVNRLAMIAGVLAVTSDYLIGLSDRMEYYPLRTCADAIELLDDLCRITGSQMYINPESISLEIRTSGIVEYYNSLNKVYESIQNLPVSIRMSSLQFQLKAQNKLFEQALNTPLPMLE